MNHQKAKPGIVFGNPDQQAFFKDLRARVDDYFESTGKSRHANAEMVIKTVILLVGYIAGILYQIFYVPSPVLSLTLYAVTGVFLAGIG
ncbi:MAG: acyl-CoA desaturase, partial [bacterium]